MTIQHAGRDKLYDIAMLLDDCWKEAYQEIVSSEYLECLSSRKRCETLLKQYDTGAAEFLVMSDNDRLIGVAVYGKSITKGYEDDGEITAIYLRKDYIGKGYGHSLFTEAERLLMDKGYFHLVLDVLADNLNALEFYMKHGYEKVDARTVHLGDKDYPMIVLRRSVA